LHRLGQQIIRIGLKGFEDFAGELSLSCLHERETQVARCEFKRFRLPLGLKLNHLILTPVWSRSATFFDGLWRTSDLSDRRLLNGPTVPGEDTAGPKATL
jgi:hypothetical protein